MDVAAAMYLRDEEIDREIEREKRDREFWVRMFGGETDSEDTITVTDRVIN